jgi:beta-RFAP synthase
MPEPWTITTGSRLHFGLIRFGNAQGRRQFGGVGVMIDSPGLRLTARPAPQFAADGPLNGRVREFAESWRRHYGLQTLPSVALRIEASPPEHAGLGVGTQLGLAVARALEFATTIGRRPLAETASSVGRGRRSAIGVHGFELGGLVYEIGKTASEALAPLAARVALPGEWRFVLLRPREARPGLAGESESAAFESLPPVPEGTAARLVELAAHEIVPAARAADFPRFSAAVGEYNQLSGSCYKSSQGGAFASEAAAAVVARLKGDGVAGVGQSSWGPTLFAAFASPNAAQEALELYRRVLPEWQLEVSSPRNVGHEARRTD